jgi:hypothetical protein
MARSRYVVAVVALGLAAVLAGCGSQKTERDELAAYIKHVNTIETSLTQPLSTVTTTAGQFSVERRSGTTSAGNLLDVAHQRALSQARGQIDAAGRRLATLSPPDAARKLHGMLLALVQRQSSLTGELEKLVVFLPAFERTLQPLAPATIRLQRALTVTQPLGYGTAGVNAELAVKAAALRRYRDQLGGVVTGLRKLSPPAVSTPQYDTQLTSLERMGTDAGALATALVHGQHDVSSLLQNFDAAAAATQSAGAQRAQIAAVKAYDSRTRSLNTLARQIELERTRLADTLK